MIVCCDLKLKDLDLKSFITYLETIGLDVNTHTKARGNKGFYSNNRIDISKTLDRSQKLEILVHEFAHFVHSKLERDIAKTGGSLEVLFKTNYTDEIKKELYELTLIVDESARGEKFKALKNETKENIKLLSSKIKKTYPSFVISEPFLAFNNYVRKSDARYFLKYDVVKVVTPFLKREKIYSVKSVEKDFPQMPEAFVDYIKLLSYKRLQSKISRRLNKYKKYYERPTELFARFIQSFVIDSQLAKKIAPKAYDKFCELLLADYYPFFDFIFDYS